MASGHEADDAGGRGTREKDHERAAPSVPADVDSGAQRVQRLSRQRLAAQLRDRKYRLGEVADADGVAGPGGVARRAACRGQWTAVPDGQIADAWRAQA